MISRDRSLLCPLFAAQLIPFEQKLALLKLPFALFEALRSWEQQADYYAQGRTKSGTIITNAQPGDSWHQYGLAADYALATSISDKPGLQWSWYIKSDANRDGHNDWQQMAETAVQYGLEAGYYWKKFPDLPHVQNRFGLTLADAKELYLHGGIKAVWEACK
jgi:peptidoglycan LD-endopeptidase CwlK